MWRLTVWHDVVHNCTAVDEERVDRGYLSETDNVGKTLAGYKRGRPFPVLPRMGRPLPVLPRIRPRLPRGTQRVPHDGMPRQTTTSTRDIRVKHVDMSSQ